MGLALRAYARVPVWTQNLLLSAYGLHLRRLRYGPTGRHTLQWLRSSQWLDAEKLKQLQLEELTRVVTAAATDVEFYRRRGMQPIEFTSFEQLREIPLLTKEDVQGAGRELISDRHRSGRLSEVHTGGTTGKPLAIYCDAETLQRNYAFFTRFKEWAGVFGAARIATFAGRTLVPEAGKAPYWRRNRAANTMLFSSYHIGPNTLPYYVDTLATFKPDLIDTYPSSIEPIARHLIDNGITNIRPRAVITSSETLFPAVRSLIEQAFGCPVFDHYGSAEMAALVTQCEAGTYHVVPEFGVVEILDNGVPVGVGERGEIVATGFINPVMPLLRYATGDYAVRGEDACRCGRAGPTIASIEGRMDDVVVTPEGNLVGRLDPIFKAVSSLYETRIVQDAADHLRVETVVRGELAHDQERELERQLRARVGPTMRISIVRVPSIERTARGKLRTVVNLVHKKRSERNHSAPI
ncbi:MAG TPA: hypothetical protein VJS39_09885 [Gemmatimonadaceae bacterium]|nr:hypothetical protein [Gemmatimonadaceae bacterium]